jgi:hypothetical protein
MKSKTEPRRVTLADRQRVTKLVESHFTEKLLATPDRPSNNDHKADKHTVQILNLACATFGMVEGAYRYVNGNPFYLSAWFGALTCYAVFSLSGNIDKQQFN